MSTRLALPVAMTLALALCAACAAWERFSATTGVDPNTHIPPQVPGPNDSPAIVMWRRMADGGLDGGG